MIADTRFNLEVYLFSKKAITIISNYLDAFIVEGLSSTSGYGEETLDYCCAMSIDRLDTICSLYHQEYQKECFSYLLYFNYNFIKFMKQVFSLYIICLNGAL